MDTNPANGNHESRHLRCLLDRIANKWSILVVGLLEDGPLRFSELQRQLGGVTQKVLTQTLRGLERDGLVSRTVQAQVPPRVDYELTALGRLLSVPLAELAKWALAHADEVESARAAFDARQ